MTTLAMGVLVWITERKVSSLIIENLGRKDFGGQCFMSSVWDLMKLSGRLET